jgi:uncharacterized protein YqfA (UPF0365 family)
MLMLSVSLFFSGLQWLAIAGIIVGIVFAVVFAKLGAYWLQAYMCGADVSLKSLIVMALLKLDIRTIVNAKIMARQADLSIDRLEGITTSRLQAHHLAGGDVTKVVQASIAAKQAGIELDFERAAAIDLAGRDVLLAVQTSISPMIIRCPPMDKSGTNMLSAVAKNGVEVRADARVTVRTQLDQLIGGATEETIIARVGQAIISAIGSSNSHMDVLALPSRISKGAMQNGLDKNTAFAIVSIDIYHLVIGENIGARLQSDQAAADMRIAQAFAEGRRTEAVALTQLMKAKIAEFRAAKILAEAEIPLALAEAFRAGRLSVFPKPKHPLKIATDLTLPTVMTPAVVSRNKPAL